MFEDLNKEQVDSFKTNIGIIRRFFDKALGYLLFSLYIYYIPIYVTKDPFTGFYVTKAYVIAGVIILMVFFYSIVRMSSVYAKEMEERFFDSEASIESFGQKIKYIFAQKENKAEMIALLAFFIIFPAKALNPGFYWLLDNGSDFTKLKVLLVVVPLLFVIYLFAQTSALKYWDKEGRRTKEKIQYLSENTLAEFLKEEKKQRRRFESTMYLAYYVGSMGLLFFFPALFYSVAPLLGFLLEKTAFILFILCIFFPMIYRNTKALIKRRKFLKALNKLCREKKYRLSKIKAPYKSLFSLQEGESFSVNIGKKRYSCKMIATKKRGTPLYLTHDGKATYLVKVRFLKLVLFSYTKSFSFDYESDCKKILIINPVPQRLLMPKTEFEDMMDEQVVGIGKTPRRLIVSNMPGSNQSEELDNGDIVGGFEIYAAKAFLNALERDCIDKD